MHAELEDIKDSWDKNTGDGRDEDGTRALASAYVAAHPEAFAGLEQFDNNLPLLVDLLSQRRASGDEQGTWELEAWLLHRFPPQNIGGAYRAEVKLPDL